MSEEAGVIVCQNWLMKRSQMTRVFSRRFIAVYNNGRVYSFRKVDLTKPLDLKNASLVYDIKGCTVEAMPRRKNTFSVHGGENVKQQDMILQAPSTSSATQWMRNLSWVTHLAQHGETIPPSLSMLTVTIHAIEPPIRSLFSPAIYAEIEGSLTRMTEMDDQHSRLTIQIPLRDNKPDEPLIIKIFHPDNEQPIGETAAVHRYRFYRCETTVPWTSEKAVWYPVVPTRASSPTSTSAQMCSIYMTTSLTEGLRDYILPVYTGIKITGYEKYM